MMRICVIFFILFFLTGCALHPLQGLRGPASIGVGQIAMRDCFAKLDEQFDTYHVCSSLSFCAERRARGENGFERYSRRLWHIIDQISPRKRPPYELPISAMRLNAERAGPQAVDIFNTVMNIRHQCLIETGLRDVIDDS